MFADPNDHHLAHEAPQRNYEPMMIAIEVVFFMILIGIVALGIAAV